MRRRRPRLLPPRRRPCQRGVTLVELLISLALGLVVISAALGVFFASRDAYRGIGVLSRFQENARIVFDLMSRAMREVGGVPCGVKPDTVTIEFAYGWYPKDSKYKDLALEGRKDAGFEDVSAQIETAGGGYHTVKYTDSAAGDSVRFITLASETGGGISPIIDKSGDKLVLQSISGFDKNGLILACNPDTVKIFTGGDLKSTPTASMPERGEYPVGTDWAEIFAPKPDGGGPYYLAMLQPEAWFIGANERGGTSLYRITGAGDDARADEIAPDATRMTLSYLVHGKSAYQDASEIKDDEWPSVVAIRVGLTLSDNSALPREERIERILMHTVTLRNRL